MFANGPSLLVSGGGGPPPAPTTWDPANKGAGVTLSGSDLVATVTQADTVMATNGRASGKWYFEILIGTQFSTNGFVGIAKSGQNTANGIDANGVAYQGNGNVSGASPGAAWAAGDVIGVALDLTGSVCYFYKNNVSQTSKALTAGTFYPAACDNFGSSNSFVFTLRPAAASQTYSPPAGFSPWD